MGAPNYCDHLNRPVSLGPLLGKGGEGAVHELASDPGRAAKLYLKPASAPQAEKLRHMVALARADLLRVAAWPTATLHDGPGGPVVGLVMPRVAGHKELHALYSPAHRRSVFPRANWAFLIQTGMNCAAAFQQVHAAQAVVGDVNQSNVLVSEQAAVTLIDCDSFQIRAAGKTYPCGVGVPLFTPPELQGKSFGGLERTVNHDRFGLAALIFHLLFMGRHPFSGRFLGAGDLPIERAIAQYRFAYSRGARAYQMAPPLHALALDAVSPELAALFERAFGRASAKTDARPTAEEWLAALQTFSRELGGCATDSGHTYWRALPRCPWCELMGQGAPNFFLTVAYLGRADGPVFDLEALWAEIDLVPRPDNVYQRPAPPQAVVAAPPPAAFPTRLPPEEPVHRTFLQNVAGVIAASSAVLMILAFWLLGLAIFFGLAAAVFGVWWSVLERQRWTEERERNAERAELLDAIDREAARRQARRQEALEKLQALEAQWQALADAAVQRYTEAYNELLLARDYYPSMEADNASERRRLRQRLKADSRRVQLEFSLDQEFISDHVIPDVEPTLAGVLASYGIETALDVSRDRLGQVPGLGTERTQRLIAWRQWLESRFVFDPSLVVTSTEAQALEVKHLQMRLRLEGRLRNGAEELRAATNKAFDELSQLDRRLAACVQAVAQTTADLAAVSHLASGGR